MLAEKNETIQKSIVTLKELTADEKAKMQMEARERYRRDMVVAQDFVREQCEEKIRELQKEKDEIQRENVEMSERIRFLEEQLANLNKK